MPYNIFEEIAKLRAFDEEKNRDEIAFRDKLRNYKGTLPKPQSVTNMFKGLKKLLESTEVTHSGEKKK